MIRPSRTLLGAAILAGSTLLAGCQTDAAATAPAAAMSKKKAVTTMTLKDFHGGSIPSELPLPSAPGV